MATVDTCLSQLTHDLYVTATPLSSKHHGRLHHPQGNAYSINQFMSSLSARLSTAHCPHSAPLSQSPYSQQSPSFSWPPRSPSHSTSQCKYLTPLSRISLTLPQAAQKHVASQGARGRINSQHPRWVRCRGLVLHSRCIRVAYQIQHSVIKTPLMLARGALPFVSANLPHATLIDRELTL